MAEFTNIKINGIQYDVKDANAARASDLAAKANSADVVPNSRTVNGKALSSDVTIGMSDIQGLVEAINNAGSGAVSVTTNQDGTFTIRVGSTDYTININHEHGQYLKYRLCENEVEYNNMDSHDSTTLYLIPSE